MSFEVFSIFSSGGHFVQQSGMVWAILVEDIPRNIPIMFGWKLPSGYRGYSCLKFFFIFSSGSHFVQRSRTNWAILLEDSQRNNPINSGWNLPSSYRGDVLSSKLWMTDDTQQTMDAGHRAITIAHPEHVVLRWAKNQCFTDTWMYSNNRLYTFLSTLIFGWLNKSNIAR